jgi:hypothetical protein
MNEDHTDGPLITIEPIPLSQGNAVVTVTADVDGNGNIQWSHDNGPSHGGNGKLKLGKDQNYEIIFNLVDKTKRKIRFDASAPFFVKEGNGSCPRAKDSDQVMVASCDAKKLVILDWNYGVPCELQYQLNFIDEAGAPITPYDPIIENGGGGTKPTLNIANQ